MFRSIRGSLLIWQAVILAAVICGFGTWFYRWTRKGVTKELDGQLLGVAQVLAKDVQTSPQGSVQPAVAPHHLRRFGRRVEDQPYFVVWSSDGRRLAASPRTDDVPRPNPRLPGRAPHPWRHRTRDGNREVQLIGPNETQILVGKPTIKEQAKLDRLWWQIVGSGAGLFAVGLIGSWLLAQRALRPIAAITSTAESISADDLSRRINLDGTHTELGRLAAVLNDTFARLEAEFQRQRRFTADASHELRTPISVILAQTEMSLQNPRSPDEYVATLQACQRAAGRMKALTENLLQLAKADAGRLCLRREPFSLRDTVRDCVDLLRPLAAERGVQLNAELESVEICGDSAALGVAVLNVLKNALSYNRQAGSVEVTLSNGDDRARLVVSDTGIGVSPENAGRVFERFFRADPARTSENGGSGLGLSIAQEIVHAHRGTIEFTSDLGRGTTVVIEIPGSAAP